MVLFYLADRHNPDYGCFPTQSTLAADTEMSVASVNNHLNALEDMGLIRRVQRVDRKTGKQLSTRYILGFEEGFTPKPSLNLGVGQNGTTQEQETAGDWDADVDQLGDNSLDIASPDSKNGPEPTPSFEANRLQNLESNPVSEPIKEPVKEEDAQARDEFNSFFQSVLFAVGFKPGAELPGWWQGDSARNHVKGWQRLGLSRESILEVAEKSRKDHPEPPDGPKGLDRAMERAAKEKPGKGSAKAKASPEEVLAFWADLVNGNGPLVPGSVSPTMRQSLLSKGLVTEARLRERKQ
jgi:hypothetical protein